MIIGTMAYNGRDIKVSKTDSGGAKTFKRAGVGVISAVLSDGAASYTPGISEKRGGASSFYSGGIKNTDTQTEASQAVSASRLYDAFGNVIFSTGVWNSPFGNAGKFGYQEDPDTGLKLLGHRYYDSSTGRFLTRDPAKDGRNWYVYCNNDPANNFDPDGFVKITAYWYGVAGIGNHYFLVIEDNVKGSPTYGEKWYVSGYPEKGSVNPRLEAQCQPDKAHSGVDPYDEGSTVQGGIVLGDDQSAAKPWVKQAERGVRDLNAWKTQYYVLGNNSNTVFFYILIMMGLENQFDKARSKRKAVGRWDPWAPGIGMPAWRFPKGPVPWGAGKSPPYHEVYL